MDQPGIAPDVHHGALQGLSRINRFSGTVGAIWKPIAETQQRLGRPLRVLDVACGGGDLAISLARRGSRRGVPLEVAGCDLSDVAIDYARQNAARQAVAANFFRADVLAQPLPAGYDVICSSLFLHHLETDDAANLLRGMHAAGPQLILISDLLRTRLGYVLAWTGCRVLTRNRLCRIDGPLSVRAAFRVAEVVDLVAQCGLSGARVEKRWPERFLLVWEASP
ncbi:methyltransferase domain-containing protein [Roseimaritima sediminicola]|uniref:methyltransferase domain-containing protein n=1 Tax=Roseimaritima sediminicola TaxID=2662066 RepID=UPI0012982CB4|nr:methyltransferase domain-containing protein [Roseimaritima sediminicola]